MSLTTRTGMRRCGKRWTTENAALRSKKGLTGEYEAVRCEPGCGGVHLEKAQSFTATARERDRKQRQAPKDTIPPKVRGQVDQRDSHEGTRLCVHCGSPSRLHRHHRRLKGSGGDPRPHTDCACNIASLCGECHFWAHNLDRREAEAEGLIIPASVTEPWLEPVMVHDQHGGATMFPTCDGRWIEESPAGGAAA